MCECAAAKELWSVDVSRRREKSTGMTSIFQEEKARWNKEKLETLTREGCVF